MNLKDKVFLGKFRVKESSILIGLEKDFGCHSFPLWAGWGGVLPPSINK